MKFKDDERIFTLDRIAGIYPTEMTTGTIIGYNHTKKKYLVNFDKYVGGHVYTLNGKITKLGFGCYCHEYELTKIDKLKDFAKEDTEDTNDEAIV